MTQGIYRVEYNRQLAPDVWEMRLTGDTSAITAPGQFINIRLDGLSSAALSLSVTGTSSGLPLYIR